MERIIVNNINDLVKELTSYVGNKDMKDKLAIFRVKGIEDANKIYDEIIEACRENGNKTKTDELCINILKVTKDARSRFMGRTSGQELTSLFCRLLNPVDNIEKLKLETNPNCITIIGVTNDVQVDKLEDVIDFEIITGDVDTSLLIDAMCDEILSTMPKSLSEDNSLTKKERVLGYIKIMLGEQPFGPNYVEDDDIITKCLLEKHIAEGYVKPDITLSEFQDVYMKTKLNK